MKSLYRLTLCLLFLAIMNVYAGSFEGKKYEFGIAPGILLSGNVYISLYGDNVRQNSNFLIRSYADAYIIPQLAFGVYFNYTTLNLEKDIKVFDKEIKKSGTPIWEIGASIKPRFVLSEKAAVKPGLNIGRRRFSGESDFAKWNGLALNGSCEIQYRFSDKISMIEETGFLYQPYGGNVDTDITFDPLLYFVFGIAF